MKNAFLLSPLSAAILFTIPEAWQLMHRPESTYIPLVFEALLLIFGYLAASIINGIIIVPLCLLVKMKSSSLLAGTGLAVVVALIGTTIAYAFEIFQYQSSILHPAYLYPVLLPLFVMTVITFFLITRTRVERSAREASSEDDEAENAD